MRSILAALILVVLISLVAIPVAAEQSKGFVLDNVMMTGGRGTLSKELTFDATWKKGPDSITLTTNTTRFHVFLRRSLGRHFHPAISLGIYDNTPWGGAQFVSKFGPATVTNWGGYSTDAIESNGWDPQLFVGYNRVELSRWGLSTSVTLQHFCKDKPKVFVGCSVGTAINKNFGWRLGYEYNIKSFEDLYQVKLTWRP